MSLKDGSTPELTPLQQALLTIEKLQKKLAAAHRGEDDAIAIIGMGCRFPGGASSPARFRELLWGAREAVTEIPADRRALQGLYDPDPSKPGKMYLRRAAFVDGVDRFDAEFFRISRREAEGMDPQQRFFLEVSWEALEDAGISPHRLAGTRTGVFAGVHAKDYAFVSEGGLEKVGAHYSTGVDASYVAGRLSYLLGLEGPSMAVDTACSSSLAAVHLACQSLRTEESTLAIAGGVKLILSPQLSVFLSKAGALSPSNRCRAFDRDADGMVQGEGCGVVILKRYRDALRDGDRILATIRGTAMNHDGASGGLTVPNVRAQEALYRLALQRARVEPGEVDFVEAHGTGTRLGDPIELEGVSRVYGGARTPERPLWIGSVKPNIGHTEAAAGVAGLIKAVLVLQAGELPPSIHFENPNPEFAWEGSGLAVPKERKPLANKAGPHLAAVSSFGMSGVNAHALVEAHREAASVRPEAGPYLLPLSAHSEPALRELAETWLRLLTDGSVKNLRDACFTAGVGRAHHEQRLALVARTPEELRSLLQAAVEGRAGEGIFRGRVKAAGGREDGSARHEDLSSAARLYCEGAPVRFEELHPGAKRTVVPTYPWQRERYWWDGEREPAKVEPAVAEGPAENAEVLQGLFCELAWNVREASREQARLDGTWLIVAEEPEAARELRDGMTAAGGLVIVASAGPSYEKVSARDYRLDFNGRESFSRLLDELASAGQELRGVIFRSRTGQPETLEAVRGAVRREAIAVTSIVQALARVAAAKPPRLYLVTRGAQAVGGEAAPVTIAGAPLWGLGRVIAYEHPELGCKRVDADPTSGPESLRALVAELGRRLPPAEDDDEIVLRGDRRLAPSLTQGRRTQGNTGAFRPRRDRTYLITGGLGGIGLRLASWLVARGARHLAVCGRSGETPEARKALELLRAAGARVEAFRVDVSRPEAVAEMLAAIRRGGTPLGGIFHAAGVLADGSLLQLEPRSFDTVMGPKVDGAWNLHSLATDASIEQFVLFSSTASLIGSPGQANYAAANAFLDALAHLRRSRGLPAMSLNWGSWAEVGMAAADERRGERLAERGMAPMPVDDALGAMALTLADGPVTRGIARLDVERWRQSHPSVATSSLFRGQVVRKEESAVPDTAPRKLREVLLSMEGSARHGVLEARLKEMVSEVSKVPAERLSSTDSFDAMGFDSIMALELRDMVLGELEVSLPLKSFVDERSIEQVAAELLEKLAVASVLGAASSERKDSKRVLL